MWNFASFRERLKSQEQLNIVIGSDKYVCAHGPFHWTAGMLHWNVENALRVFTRVGLLQ